MLHVEWHTEKNNNFGVWYEGLNWAVCLNLALKQSKKKKKNIPSSESCRSICSSGICHIFNQSKSLNCTSLNVIRNYNRDQIMDFSFCVDVLTTAEQIIIITLITWLIIEKSGNFTSQKIISNNNFDSCSVLPPPSPSFLAPSDPTFSS